VTHILSAAAEVFGTERLDVWTTAGRFVDAKTAREEWHQTASANWLALATFAGRYAPSGTALLMDVGTTTTDLIPLSAGNLSTGRTDAARLVSGELLYRGWRRTPLCAIYHEGAAEWFATMHDVCLVLHRTPDCPDDRDTADGQPATREAALRRLARMRMRRRVGTRRRSDSRFGCRRWNDESMPKYAAVCSPSSSVYRNGPGR
jgi:probable H4MPT-linked C1 transfer pathway protein